MRERVFDSGGHSGVASLGLLILRVFAGFAMAAGHGWGKLTTFADRAATFPDPLHIGHQVSMACTIGAEFFCALLVALGLGTRLAAIPVAFTMAVAAFVVQAGAPFGKKELALAYLAVFLLFVFTGAGSYSVDARLGGRRRRS